MKPLTSSEIESLGALLRRAIASNQFNLHVASPFQGDIKEAQKHGFTFNDRHDGNAIASDQWNVETTECEGEEPPDWKPYHRSEISVYIDQESLDVLNSSVSPSR